MANQQFCIVTLHSIPFPEPTLLLFFLRTRVTWALGTRWFCIKPAVRNAQAHVMCPQSKYAKALEMILTLINGQNH